MRHAWLLSALLLSCDGKRGEPDGSDTDVPPDTALAVCDDPMLTWEGFAQPFLTTWCLSCHGSQLVGDERHGAPVEFAFDTLEMTQPFGELIRSVAVDSNEMPPTDAIAPADRARLGDWIDCGMPGPDVPAPTLILCDDPQLYTGDVTASAMPPGLCTEWNAVSGDLALDVASTDTSCLCEVRGSLTVTAPGQVSLTELTSVGGDLTLSGTTPLVSFAAPFLTSVGGNVFATDAPGLQTVSLPRLATVGGGLIFARDPALTEITSMQGVLTVGAGLQFEDLDSLVSLDAAPRALTVGGRIAINRNEALEELWVGDVLIDNGPGINIENNPALLVVNGFQYLQSAGPVTLRDLPRLAALPTLSQLRSVGSFVVAGTQSLTSLAGLEGLRDASSIEISSNVALTDVSALSGITGVDGNFDIVNNPALPTSAVDALIEDIGLVNIGGCVTTTGNGPG
jgi:hypothetical protein